MKSRRNRLNPGSSKLQRMCISVEMIVGRAKGFASYPPCGMYEKERDCNNDFMLPLSSTQFLDSIRSLSLEMLCVDASIFTILPICYYISSAVSGTGILHHHHGVHVLSCSSYCTVLLFNPTSIHLFLHYCTVHVLLFCHDVYHYNSYATVVFYLHSSLPSYKLVPCHMTI